MTALKEFERLEATALWRETAEAKRRDVFVSIGDTSMVISDINETALSHWSLAAIQRRNPGQSPALLAPGPDADETLEVEDPVMLEAIERLQQALHKKRPRRGRIRVLALSILVVTIAALGVAWLPKALKSHTLSVVPQAKRTLIGQALLNELILNAGQPCAATQSLDALAHLLDRTTTPQSDVRIVVLRQARRPTLHLPGGLIVVSGPLIELLETPEALAGFVMTEWLRTTQGDPLADYLDFVGYGATFRLLTTGETDPQDIRDFAAFVLETPRTSVPVETQLFWFKQLELPTSPYAYAIDPTGESTFELIEADPYLTQPAPEVLDDASWLTLQNICRG